MHGFILVSVLSKVDHSCPTGKVRQGHARTHQYNDNVDFDHDDKINAEDDASWHFPHEVNPGCVSMVHPTRHSSNVGDKDISFVENKDVLINIRMDNNWLSYTISDGRC
jgi:hypothetical protein